MKRIAVTLVLLLTLFVCNVVFAQEATEVPTADVTEQVVTVVPTEVEATPAPDVVIDVGGEAPVDPAEPWWAKYAVQMFIVLAGLTGFLVGLNMWLKRTTGNASLMNSIEYGYRAFTPDSIEDKADQAMVGLAKELEELGGNAAKFLRMLGTRGEVIAQRVDAEKQTPKS